MADKVDTTTLAIRSLDLTARVVDLTSALGQASTVANGLIEIGQWLALERVNKQELHNCFTKARGLVYANKAGEEFYSSITSSDTTKRIWPLAVQQSGALGRIMIKDPHLAWVISTTACLMQYHNERFISEAICMMIMQSDPQNQGRPEYELRYLASRVELKAVIDKIITSVWFNVINSGTNTEQLPEELQAVCRKGHHMNGDKFGLVTYALKEFREKVVIETKHLLSNLALWLLLHFHGTLTVSVSGKLLFEKALGESPRVIELKVKNFCNESHDCSNEEDTFRLYSDIKGSFTEFLSGTYPSSFDMPSTSKTRKSLYDIMRAYDIGADILPEQTKTATRQTAQLMVKWLLNLPLVSPLDFADFGFSIRTLDIEVSEAKESPQTIGGILGRSPSILNHIVGHALNKSIIYAPPEYDRESSVESIIDESPTDGTTRPPRRGNISATFQDEDILAYFPVLRDLVIKAKGDCSCNDCTGSRNFGAAADRGVPLGHTIPPGCYSQAAVSWVLLSISHALAEGFGATDVSGSGDPESILKGMVTVFSELLQRKQVRWDSWFNLASCVYLGCPFKEYVMDIELGGTAYVAIQYGNLAVLAPWLDLTSELNVKHCFRFNRAEGKIGVLRDSEGSQQFRGIPEKFAIVQAEHTEDTSSYGQRFQKWTEPLTGTLAIAEDDSSFHEEVMLVSADQDVYRVFIRIRSDTSLRIIDPVDAMIRLARSLPFVECQHEENRREITEVRDDIKLYTFDDLLGRWQNEETFYGVNKVGPAMIFHGKKGKENAPGLTYHVTTFLQDFSKINVARALSVNDLVIVNLGGCCLPCAIEKARTMPIPDDTEGFDVQDRYIINIKNPQKHAVRKSKRKFDKTTEKQT
jgi:hypothetical protein